MQIVELKTEITIRGADKIKALGLDMAADQSRVEIEAKGIVMRGAPDAITIQITSLGMDNDSDEMDETFNNAADEQLKSSGKKY